MPGNRSTQDRQKLARAERQRQVIELRKAGLTHQEIADRLSLDRHTVGNLIKRALTEIVRAGGVEEMRDLEGDRLDRLQAAIWTRALQGDVPAINTALRIMERRARLFGLDAPVQVQATVETFDANNLDDAVARLLRLSQATTTTGKETATHGIVETTARQLGMASDTALGPVREGEVRGVGMPDVDGGEPVRDPDGFGVAEVVAGGDDGTERGDGSREPARTSLSDILGRPVGADSHNA